MKRLMLPFLLVGVFATALLPITKGSAEEIELWGTSVSPYVRKVQNVLDYKQLPYKQHDILPKVLLEATGQQVPARFLEASLLGRIPALTAGKVKVADSAVIAACLEKEFPSKNVYPTDCVEFARARFLETYSDGDLTKVIAPIFFERVVNPLVLGVKCDEEKVQRLIDGELPKVLAFLDQRKSETSARYLVSDQLTIADFAIIHLLINLNVAEVEWKTGQFPALETYYKTMIKEQIILNSIPEFFLEKIG